MRSAGTCSTAACTSRMAAYPLVPKDEVGFRIQVTAANADDEIDLLCEVLGEMEERFELQHEGHRELLPEARRFTGEPDEQGPDRRRTRTGRSAFAKRADTPMPWRSSIEPWPRTPRARRSTRLAAGRSRTSGRSGSPKPAKAYEEALRP